MIHEVTITSTPSGGARARCTCGWTKASVLQKSARARARVQAHADAHLRSIDTCESCGHDRGDGYCQECDSDPDRVDLPAWPMPAAGVTTVTAVDHVARAERLRVIVDGLRKLNEDCLDDIADFDKPEVKARFACVQWDGDSTYIVFADTLDEARDTQAGAPSGDYPWGPDDVHDLDTGHCYLPELAVTLHRYTHRVVWSFRGDPRMCNFLDEAGAEKHADVLRRAGHASDVTVEVLPE